MMPYHIKELMVRLFVNYMTTTHMVIALQPAIYGHITGITQYSKEIRH